MLRNLLKKTQKGFTIIEVMIVLAIAGLILVVVLIAVPQLQKNQRDSTRQNVVSRLSTELGNYSSNNNGSYPFGNATALSDFLARYITGEVDIANPSTGTNYTLRFATGNTDNPGAGEIIVHRGGECVGEGATGTITTANTTTRQYALRLALEAGDIYYCVDNN